MLLNSKRHIDRRGVEVNMIKFLKEHLDKDSFDKTMEMTTKARSIQINNEIPLRIHKL